MPAFAKAVEFQCHFTFPIISLFEGLELSIFTKMKDVSFLLGMLWFHQFAVQAGAPMTAKGESRPQWSPIG
jgi:hypothetical protein